MAVGDNYNEYNTDEDAKTIDALPADLYHYPEDEVQKSVEEETEEVSVAGGTVMLDPSKWSYKDYAEFLKWSLRGDWERAFPVIMKATIGWTFNIPFTEDAYQHISFADLPVVAAVIDETVQGYVKTLDTKRVKLNLRKWSMADYFAYRQAAQKGDIPALEDLFRKCARLDGLPKDGPLSFEHGVLIATALGEQVKKMFAKGE